MKEVTHYGEIGTVIIMVRWSSTCTALFDTPQPFWNRYSGQVFSHFCPTYIGCGPLGAFLDADYDERFRIANFETLKTAIAEQIF